MSKKRNLSQSFQLVCTTCKKEIPPWLWMEETEICHKLTTPKIGNSDLVSLTAEGTPSGE